MNQTPSRSTHQEAARTAAIDVANLKSNGLPQQNFPAPRAAEFRVFLSARVHEGIWRHAEENVGVEVCGVLVGRWAGDADGPYADVSEFIRCDGAAQKFAEVTFTHDSWNQINKEMDTKYADLRVVGWYHTHPNFGIFLSDRDNFIHQHFFSEPGHIALVVDPVRKIEGVFVWRRGKTTTLSHYWVGDRILSGAPASPDGVERASEPTATSAASAPRAAREASTPWLMLGLLGLCLFQFGYMLSGLFSSFQHAKLQEGAVAHYGIWKLYKPGFEESIAVLARVQEDNRQEVRRLAATLPVAGDEKLAEATKKAWAEIDRRLTEARMVTSRVGEVYGLNEVEKQEMLRLIAEKMASQPAPPGSPSAKPEGTPAASPTPSSTPSSTGPTTPAATPTTPAATPTATASSTTPK